MRTRLALYTLYLIMITEGPTRGYAGARHEEFMADLRGRLDELLATL